MLDEQYRWHRYARIWRTPVLGEVFQTAGPRPVFRWLLGRQNPHLTRSVLDGLYAASHGRPTSRAILALYRAAPEVLMRGPVEQLAALDRPALVLWGTDDRYLPYTNARTQRSAFPSAHIELLDGHGHWVHLEAPDLVASHVVPFLHRQTHPERPGTSAPPSSSNGPAGGGGSDG